MPVTVFASSPSSYQEAGDHGVGRFQAELLDQKLAKPPPETGGDHRIGELHHALVVLRERDRLQSFRRRQLRAEEPNVAEVVDAGGRIARALRSVQRAEDLLEPPVGDHLGELRLNLHGLGVKPRPFVEGEPRDPAIGRRVVRGVAITIDASCSAVSYASALARSVSSLNSGVVPPGLVCRPARKM